MSLRQTYPSPAEATTSQKNSQKRLRQSSHDIAHDTGVWFKCFCGTRTKQLLLDVDGRDYKEIMKEVQEVLLPENDVEGTMLGETVISRLVVDFLDEMGRRVRLDSNERLQEAVEVYDRLKRNFIYLFCDILTEKTKLKHHSIIQQNPEHEQPHSSGQVPDLVDRIVISNEAKARHLMEKSHPPGPKYHTHIKSRWNDPSLVSKNPVLGRYQQQILRRQQMHQQFEICHGLPGKANENRGTRGLIVTKKEDTQYSGSRASIASSLTEQTIRSTKTVRRIDASRDEEDPAWRFLNTHIATKKKGYLSRLTSGVLRQLQHEDKHSQANRQGSLPGPEVPLPMQTLDQTLARYPESPYYAANAYDLDNASGETAFAESSVGYNGYNDCMQFSEAADGYGTQNDQGIDALLQEIDQEMDEFRPEEEGTNSPAMLPPISFGLKTTATTNPAVPRQNAWNKSDRTIHPIPEEREDSTRDSRPVFVPHPAYSNI